MDKAIQGGLAKAGLVSIPLTIIILMIVLGSFVAALIPLLARITSIIATMGLIAFASQVVPTSENIMEVVLLIGLAVGVDYSLFYIRREREERKAGRSEGAALAAAAATSGRAVLVSGITVLIAMAGMFFSGDQDFMSFCVGTMLVVAVAMLGSLTVLPPCSRSSATGSRRAGSRSCTASAATRARAACGARSSIASSGTRSSRRSPRPPCSSRWPCRRSACTPRRPAPRA